MSKTDLLYFHDTYLLRHAAKIEQITNVSDGSWTIIIDRTMFYPQGGGQPSDIGTISSQSGWTAQVTMVRMNSEGRVEHDLQLSSSTLLPNESETVKLEVDENVRMLHARLHTAGHLLSHAIEQLELPLRSTKGYHFPVGPYVEYRKCSEESGQSLSWDEIKKRIEDCCNEMIRENRQVEIILKDSQEVDGEGLSKKAQEADVVRYIAVEGTKNARPCGGTHVKRLATIGQMTIKKISTKNGVIRISYLVNECN